MKTLILCIVSLYYTVTIRYLNNLQNQTSVIQLGWIIMLQKFNFLLKHKSRVQNKVMDALCRTLTLRPVLRVEVTGFDLLKRIYEFDENFGLTIQRLHIQIGSFPKGISYATPDVTKAFEFCMVKVWELIWVGE